MAFFAAPGIGIGMGIGVITGLAKVRMAIVVQVQRNAAHTCSSAGGIAVFISEVEYGRV